MLFQLQVSRQGRSSHIIYFQCGLITVRFTFFAHQGMQLVQSLGQTRWAQKQLISATIFARPGRAAVSSKPDARDTVKWLTMPVYGLIDRPRATLQRCCSAGVHAKFLLSSPRCCGFVTPCSQLKFVAVVGPGSESFVTRVRRLFQLVLLALGRRNRKPKSCRT